MPWVINMKIEYCAQNAAVLHLGEVFDFEKVDQFRKAYEQLDLALVRTLSIDFAKTKYMDSSALGMLLNMKSYFGSQKISIKIINTKDQIKKILSISRFDQKFIIE
jgi:HptB-dependent secretion and biofilm anti anti-sigma factor